MRKFLLSFLLATVAAIPVAAQAQQEDFAVQGGERGFESRGERSNGGWRSQRAQRSAPAPQVQAPPQAPAPQTAAERGQAQYSERRNDRQARGAVRTPDTMNTSPDPRGWENRREGERRFEDRRDDQQQRRYGWNRGNGQPVTPPPVVVPQQPRQDWNNGERDRWANRNRNEDRNRWDGNRRDGNRDRYDNDSRDRDGRRYAYRTPNGRDGRNWDDNWQNRSWFDNDSRFDRWNNDWRRDRRYDWRSFRSQNRDFYRLPRYSHPYGYNFGYRRFSVGVFLDDLFFSERYWINDPYEYRLPPAYGPYRWVRYYDDVMLVDLRNGRVVDVIYGLFF
jgi:hypothetical protein